MCTAGGFTVSVLWYAIQSPAGDGEAQSSELARVTIGRASVPSWFITQS